MVFPSSTLVVYNTRLGGGGGKWGLFLSTTSNQNWRLGRFRCEARRLAR